MSLLLHCENGTEDVTEEWLGEPNDMPDRFFQEQTIVTFGCYHVLWKVQNYLQKHDKIFLPTCLNDDYFFTQIVECILNLPSNFLYAKPPQNKYSEDQRYNLIRLFRQGYLGLVLKHLLAGWKFSIQQFDCYDNEVKLFFLHFLIAYTQKELRALLPTDVCGIIHDYLSPLFLFICTDNFKRNYERRVFLPADNKDQENDNCLCEIRSLLIHYPYYSIMDRHQVDEIWLPTDEIHYGLQEFCMRFYGPIQNSQQRRPPKKRSFCSKIFS